MTASGVSAHPPFPQHPAGFISGAQEELEKDEDYDDAVVESTDDLLTPHRPGMLAITEIGPNMRAFLCAEVPPQLFSAKPSDCLIFRHHLNFKGAIFSCEDMFVGSLGDKLFIVPKKRFPHLEALEFKLAAVDFPKKKESDWNLTWNLLRSYSRYARESLQPLKASPSGSKFLLEFQAPLGLKYLGKSELKPSILKQMECSSASP